jgi:hypothetical protein
MTQELMKFGCVIFSQNGMIIGIIVYPSQKIFENLKKKITRKPKVTFRVFLRRFLVKKIRKITIILTLKVM